MSDSKKIDRRFISDDDRLLAKLRAKLPLTRSQEKEIKKHEDIFRKRGE